MPSPPLTLISGGSRGLGLALVEHLLARGDHVATFSRSGSEALSALAVAHPAQLVAENLDITDSPAIGGFIARMASRFGRLDHCGHFSRVRRSYSFRTSTSVETQPCAIWG